MDSQTLIRLSMIVLAVVAIYVAMRANDRGAKKCPKCQSKNIRLLDDKTEGIHVETISLPGVGARTHVNSTRKYACQKCGHMWTQQVKT